MFAHYARDHRRSLPSGLILAAGIAALLTATPAFAATWTWNGSQGNNSWNNSLNWTPGVQPANNGTADIVFGVTPRLTPDLTLPWNVLSVTFNDTAGAYNLISTAGNTLTLGAGGITNNDADTQTINHVITLAAAQTWNAASGSLSFNGTVNNGGNLLTINAAAPVIGVQITSVINGSGGLTKNGPGVLTLSGTGINTFTGPVNVNDGTLVLTKSNPTGSGGFGSTVLNIGDGVGAPRSAIVTCSTSSNLPYVAPAVVSIQPDGFFIPLNDIIAGLTINGSAVQNDYSLVINGDITTLASSSTATISGSGIVDIVDVPRSFTVAQGTTPSGIDFDIAQEIYRADFPITKAGPGTLRLSGSNGPFFAGLIMNAGTLLVGNDYALGSTLAGPGPVTINGGVIQADLGSHTVGNSFTLNSTGTFSGALDLTITGPVSGPGGLIKNGSSTLTLAGTNNFTGPITINAGSVVMSANTSLTGNLTNQGTFVYNGGSFSGRLINAGAVTFNADFIAGNGIENDGTLTLAAGRTVTLNGAGLDNEGTFTMTGGTLNLSATGSNINRGNFNLSAVLGLGSTTLANQGFLALNGGIISGATGSLVNQNSGVIAGSGSITALLTNSGTIALTGGNLNISEPFTNSGNIELGGITARLAGGAITNAGRIQGDGTLSNALTNSATGSIRVDVGKTLFFSGAFAANAGEMNLQGGTLDFPGPVTNSATGFIAGRGALYTGGLTNNGQMAFSGGTADIHGDVSLTAGARIVTGGAGSVTTFFDDVVHNGTEIFTGAAASTVFFGNQSGAGPFTGTGTVYYTGDLRPGNSPANVNYSGDVVFSGAASLTLEIGGTTPGSEYDRLTIAGSAAIDGMLDVSLINGFTPSGGQQFTILTAGNIVNNGFVLGGPAASSFNLLVTSTSVILQALSTGVLGDYNNDGTVNAADYTVYRNRKAGIGGTTLVNDDTLGVGFDDYIRWKTHYGSTSGSGSSVSDGAANVPEPASILLACITAIALAVWRPCVRERNSPESCEELAPPGHFPAAEY